MRTKFLYQNHQTLSGLFVQGNERLVKNDKLGLSEQCEGERELFQHAAGKSFTRFVVEGIDAEVSNDPLNAFS